MVQSDFRKTALFEHRFWLQVLGDHLRFIFHSFAPKETPYINQAYQFINDFDALLGQARRNLAEKEIHALTKLSYQKTMELRNFKLELLRHHLDGKITISLSPTFINHMVNELEEYVRILTFLLRGELPPVAHPVHHHLLWLLDAAGHAGAIEDDLDHTEKKLKQKSGAFTRRFEDFYLKAVEMAGFLRTNLSQFPALARFNQDVKLEIAIFQEFLNELEEMELHHSVLSTFSALMADHMFREECYYLLKLAESTNTEKPSCDPAKPRVEGKW